MATTLPAPPSLMAPLSVFGQHPFTPLNTESSNQPPIPQIQ